MTIKRIKNAALIFVILTFSACFVPDNSTADETGVESKDISETVSTAESIIESTEPVAETTTETEPPEPEIIKITVSAAGDNLIHEPIYMQAKKRSGDGYDFEAAYAGVREIIAGSDLAMINQETLICNDVFEPSTYPMFNSPKALGDYMIEMGFDVFSIANNHTLDKGIEGLKACLEYWSDKETVVVGAYLDSGDRANIRTNEVNGAVFSYLSYTEHLNGLRLPLDTTLEIGNANETDRIIEEIKAAKEISDVCVVFLHWGIEDSDIIEPRQRDTAFRFAEAGADIIIGTHPHVLRDIELITRSDGSFALCAYSLGNFISAQSRAQNLIGGIFTFTLEVEVKTREVTFGNIGLIPIVTHYDGNYNDVRLYKLSDYSEGLALSHGVNAFEKFTYSYIIEILTKNINSEFLIFN